MIKIIKYGVSILSILLLHLYFYDNENTKYIDYKIYDMTTLLLKQQIEREEASHTVIVNIDDKSLEAIGQWPWPRIIEAQLIKKITAMHPSTVATNFLFPEKDRTSPSMLQNFYEQFFNINLNLKALPHAFQDNDKLLTNALKKADGLLSIYFKSNGVMSQHCESLSYRNNIFSNMAHLRSSSSFLCNHQEIQEQMNDFGFINAIEDNDGVVRRVALFRAYKNQIFPSFALATLLKLDKNIEPINSTEFKIINHHIRTDKESRVLLNFQTKAPNIISAIDILNNHIPYSSLQGKIVLLGSTATGLNLSHHTLLYQQISNIELQSTVIDNILNDDLLRQPEFYHFLYFFYSPKSIMALFLYSFFLPLF